MKAVRMSLAGGSGKVRALWTGVVSFFGGGAAKGVDPNMLNHIFGKAGHNLDDVVKAAGSREAAFRAMEYAAQGAFKAGKLAATKAPGVFQGPIKVGGVPVIVRGTVVDGSFKIGSAWR
jgi:hypothetical protein